MLPTQTVYGLAANATTPSAVEKIFAIKGRPTSNPLIVHVRDIEQAGTVAEITPLAKQICSLFWPGPLSIILKRKKEKIPDIVSAGLNTVAIRSPLHPIFRDVLDLIDFPLAAPSANRSNRISPTRIEHVIDEFGDSCPPYIDGGPCEIGVESTVLDLSEESSIRILRLGPISMEDIEKALDKIQTYENLILESVQSSSPKSPGCLSKHYSPRAPFTLHRDLKSIQQYKKLSPKDIVILSHPSNESKKIELKAQVLYLASKDDPLVFAKNFYKILREADRNGPTRIHSHLLKNESGIARALNDKLMRGSSEKRL